MSRHFDYSEDPHERTALEISTLNEETTSSCSQFITWVSSLFSDSDNQTKDSTDVPWTVVSKDGRTIKEVKFNGNLEEDHVIVDLDLEEDDVIVDLNSDADCVENGSDVAILDHSENTTRHDHTVEVLINLKVKDDATDEAHRQASSPGLNSHLGPNPSNASMGPNLSNASMGSIVNILEYSKEEWGRSDTPKAQLMKKGYLSVFEHGLKYIRVCRGDNYCAVRSAIYQVLSTAIVRCVVAKSGHDYQEIVQMNQLSMFDEHIYNEWSFANRLTSNESVSELIKVCLKKFYELIFTSDLTAAKLDEYLSQDNHDVEVMEAVKVKMMLAAVELFERFQLAEEDLPMFSTILFVRDTSRTPHQLFHNHLNGVGDSGGLEQIEMFLLAHTLGITIRAFRLQQFGKADFITYYNDEGMEVSSDVRPVVNIISEDDRHYNIVLTEEEAAQYRG